MLRPKEHPPSAPPLACERIASLRVRGVTSMAAPLNPLRSCLRRPAPGPPRPAPAPRAPAARAGVSGAARPAESISGRCGLTTLVTTRVTTRVSTRVSTRVNPFLNPLKGVSYLESDASGARRAGAGGVPQVSRRKSRRSRPWTRRAPVPDILRTLRWPCSRGCLTFSAPSGGRAAAAAGGRGGGQRERRSRCGARRGGSRRRW